MYSRWLQGEAAVTQASCTISAFASMSSSPGLSYGFWHCVVFLHKTLLSQCPSPLGCMNVMQGGNAVMD